MIKKIRLSSNIIPFIVCSIFFFSSFWCYFFYLKYWGAKYFWPATFLGSYFNLPFDAVKDHFLESLLYYHIQLPLNLVYVYLFEFVLFPSQIDFLRGFIGYYFLHLLFGIWMIYTMYKMMEIYGVDKWLSCFLISFFVSTPAFYIYQSQGTHDFITMCMVTISAYLMILALRKNDFNSYFWFFLMLAILINIRSLYHPLLFFIPIVVTLLIINFSHKKNLLLAALFPFLLALSPYLKNYFVFDKFTATTHAGVIYVQSTYEQFATKEEKMDLLNRGIFSDLVLCTLKYDDVVHKRYIKFNGATYDKKYCDEVIGPKYGKKYLETQNRNFDNIPILWGIGNKESINQDNHIYLIGRNDQNSQDAFADLITIPSHFFAKLDEVWRITFKPAIAFMYGNALNVRNLPDGFMWMSHNIWPGGSYTTKPYGGSLETRASLPLVILFPTLLLFAIALFLNLQNFRKYVQIFFISLTIILISFILIKTHSIAAWEDWKIERQSIKIMFGYSFLWLIFFIVKSIKEKNKPQKNSDEIRYLSLYFFMVILYSTNLTALLSGTEHNRYRIYIDPFLLILMSALITKIFRRKKIDSKS